MDKPPKGKHSTKGLGKKVPQDSEFAKWRGDVTVPCGKPVSSKVKASELMYNEYIVYNTAQVTSVSLPCSFHQFTMGYFTNTILFLSFWVIRMRNKSSRKLILQNSASDIIFATHTWTVGLILMCLWCVHV